MNNTAKLTLVAAAIVAVAFLGFRFMLPANVGGPGLGDSTPPPTSTPSPSPRALLQGAEGPGTFTTEFLSEEPVADPVQITFEMPAGWAAAQSWLISATSDTVDTALVFIHVNGLYSDPCLANSGTPDVPVGSTADELASALTAQTAYEATVTGDVTIDGHPGVRMELRMPTDLEYTSCENGQFWVWDAPLVSEIPNRWELVILDVDGTTTVLLADVTGATAESRDQIEQMLQSAEIDR